MSPLRDSQVISVSIDAPAESVYAFVAEPRHLHEWAAGLGSAAAPLEDGGWRVETPAGPMRVDFAPANPFGVVDHVVSSLGGGSVRVDVPLRVVPNGDGAEVMLTLFRQEGMTDAQFAADAAAVRADLHRLKSLMERGA